MNSLFEHIDKKVVSLILIGGLILVGASFYFLQQPTVEPGAVTRIDASPLDEMLGRDLLNVLIQLKSTKLDTSIFSDPVFKSLRDFGVEIAPQPIGRHNPFAAFEGAGESGKSGGSLTGSKKSATVKTAGKGGKSTPPPSSSKDLGDFSF